MDETYRSFFGLEKEPFMQDIDFDEIHDLIAFRIIVPSIRDCYAMLGAIHSSWKPVPGRFKDYIALPKSNMYQSLHTTVFGPSHQRVELAIRTHEMQRVAEEAAREHMADLQAEAAVANLMDAFQGKAASHTFKSELICIVDSRNSGLLVTRTPNRNIVTPSFVGFHWAKRAFEWWYLRQYR